MKPISVWGLLGGHDGQRPMGKFGQDAGVTPVLFFEGHPGIFNDHRKSGPDLNIPSQFNSNDFMNFFTEKIDIKNTITNADSTVSSTSASFIAPMHHRTSIYVD